MSHLQEFDTDTLRNDGVDKLSLPEDMNVDAIQQSNVAPAESMPTSPPPAAQHQ